MGQLIDLLKRQAFFIVCGLGALVGIALMLTGMRFMPKVMEQMRKVEGTYRNITGLQAVSLGKIEAVQERIDAVLEDHKKILERARTMYGYEPLVPAALPNGDSIARNAFRDRYTEGMDALIKSLNYGGPAAKQDVDRWKDRIAEEQAQLKQFGAGGSGPPVFPGPEVTAAGVLTKAGIQKNAEARANVSAAQRIVMYARHFNDGRPEDPGSLDFARSMRGAGSSGAPEPWDVWHAQYNYWIQKDVVEAIVALNKAAADELRKNGKHPWVENLPVKDLISIRVTTGHIPAEGEAVYGSKLGGEGPALPPATPATVFTQHGATAAYDVVQFTIKAVMDERDIPKLVERLTKDRFHTLLRAAYEAVPPNLGMVGKIYGSGPVVSVILDFELPLLGPVFRRWMPAKVLEEYGITCRPEDECKPDEEG